VKIVRRAGWNRAILTRLDRVLADVNRRLYGFRMATRVGSLQLVDTGAGITFSGTWTWGAASRAAGSWEWWSSSRAGTRPPARGFGDRGSAPSLGDAVRRGSAGRETRPAAPGPGLPARDLLAALRQHLGEAGYAEDGIRQVLGEDSRPFSRHPELAVARRRLPEGPFGALIQLFLLGLPLDAGDARRALAPIPLERLSRVGLVERRARGIAATVRLIPHDGLLLACDRATPVSTRLPCDYVDGVIESAPVLAALTVRRPVASTLDLGTGSGVQALLAARHSRRVVAVDINPRALAFTALNSRLNGLRQVACRRGSLFRPVEGRRFDLIVANPPYAVSPESALRFRDSGRPADTFCRALVRQAPRFLREGGWAQILCHWVAGTNEPWWARLRTWVEGAGFDAWLLHDATYDPMAYATFWHAPLRRVSPPAYATGVDRWLRYYRRHGIEAIAAGAIFLRRRARGPNWLRADEVPAGRLGLAGDQILRTAAAQDYLARLPHDQALLDGVFRRVAGLEGMRWSGGAGRTVVLELEDGLPFRVEVDADSLMLMARCDSRRSLRAVVADLGRTTGRAPTSLAPTLLPTVRRLVRQGFLVPSTAPGRPSVVRIGATSWGRPGSEAGAPPVLPGPEPQGRLSPTPTRGVRPTRATYRQPSTAAACGPERRRPRRGPRPSGPSPWWLSSEPSW
jgi:SAM-dependent methyltransferase